ncbi:CapA family protein [Crenobacter cavernae]|uniref:CapA family protein n=1 Tax=Crenobacter cavernae TaxID=2290923 RepID=A0ABY0FD70_9NEIS|nr:CapA family protein [Crenobacter cavernae]RXZ42017.1 CapA family protein [Crenobacter cavernae]
MITMALAGDVMLGRGVSRAVRNMAASDPWGDLLPRLAAADLFIVNLECAITDHDRPWSRGWKRFHFRGGPHVLKVLAAAGVDAVSVANNHTLDFEEQGLFDTLAHLDRAGIGHAGAGRTLADAAAPAWLEAGGQKVALIAVTDNEAGFAATPTSAGTHYLPVSPSRETLAYLADLIASTRRAGADLVVFSNHWGPNMVDRPPAHFRAFARAIVELGADLYFGHSAHLVQGVEIHRGKPILYDTGDFIDDYAVDPLMRNDRSFLFLVTFDGQRLTRLELIPASLSFARVAIAQEPERATICRRMKALSAELGTRLDERDGVLLWVAEDG